MNGIPNPIQLENYNVVDSKMISYHFFCFCFAYRRQVCLHISYVSLAMCIVFFLGTVLLHFVCLESQSS